MRLLLVEDDFPLAAVFAEALEDSGYVVDVAHDGEAGWHLANEGEYGMILLDYMLPKMDGIGLCQRLRTHGCAVPILMMTARDASTDKILGLDAGADDYLVKPIDLPRTPSPDESRPQTGASRSDQPIELGGALSTSQQP